jgi:signal transduction histidine kinase
MPKKSIWESNFWKTVIAISVILTILSSSLAILNYLQILDVYNLVLLPIINFFTTPIPLYSVPLTIIILLMVLLILAYRSGSNKSKISDPLAGAEILDEFEMRFIALLCRTPQTLDFLKQKYVELENQIFPQRLRRFEYCLKELEDRGLLIFRNEKWEVTQKALDYIKKYHGDKL